MHAVMHLKLFIFDNLDHNVKHRMTGSKIFFMAMCFCMLKAKTDTVRS